MKEKLKFLIIGFVVCFAFGGIVYGASQVLDVYYSEFPITIDGYDYSPTMPVLNYQGRTYLALREFGNATGTNVDFVDNTITIDNYKKDGLYNMVIDNIIIVDSLSRINDTTNYISHSLALYYDASNFFSLEVKEALGYDATSTENIDSPIKLTYRYINYLREATDLLLKNAIYANKNEDTVDIDKIKSFNTKIERCIQDTEIFLNRAYTYSLSNYWDIEIMNEYFNINKQVNDLIDELYNIIGELNPKFFES